MVIARAAHDVVENDHGAGHTSLSDRGCRRGGILDGRLHSIAPDENAVRGQADRSVLLNRQLHRIPAVFARGAVDDVEHFGERPASGLFPATSPSGFRRRG